MDSAHERQLASAEFALVVDEYRLRPWRADDAKVMTAIVSEPDIPRWTSLPDGMTAHQAERWIENRESQRMSGSGVALAIQAQASTQILGCVGLAGLEAELGPETYDWIGASARGQGMAMPALWRVCRWAFGTAGVARVRLHGAGQPAVARCR
jgi:RimJ/RimL family protein N-acetyltransferase